LNYIDSTSSYKTIQNLLLDQGLIEQGERVLSLKKPGDGNMNVVLRVRTNERSFILKQSRPFVQKYRQIEAPIGRIAVEHQFYKTIQSSELNKNLPATLGFDAKHHILILEDLGHCEDMTSMYATKNIENNTLRKLTSILSLIHNNDPPDSFPYNMEMRRLNHQHIFVLPFLEDNGFQLDDIQEGLQSISIPYKKDDSLTAVVDEIGNKYLSRGNTLLHGDYYPGSWMTEAENIYVIDPEFGFVGFAEFDLGVMTAHIIMATSDASYLESIYDFYDGKADKKLMAQIAGIEIMRRLIGLAQLPLKRSIEEKQYLLELARKMFSTDTFLLQTTQVKT